MSTLVTRSGKGSPLTHNEVDTNFTNLNTDKVEKTAAAITGGTINNTTIGATTPSTGVFTTLTAQNEVLKGTGQNLFTYSQDYTTLWGTSNSLITSNATTAPDGSGTASKLIATTANASHLIFKTLFSFVFPFTTSIYAKAAQYNWLAISTDVGGANGFAYFNLQTGVLGTISSGFTASITSAGNGWYRCTVTRNTFTSGSGGMAFYPATADNTVTFVGDNTSGIFIWGAQLEIGSTANTYIPTTTTAVYGTPTLSFSGVASIGLQSDGSLYETSAGTGNVRFYTNNIGQEQARVSHTASAVNFVNLTGGATANDAQISALGSDTNIWLQLNGKGSRGVAIGYFTRIGRNFANYFEATGNNASSAPILSVGGSDTNIDINLTTKGTGSTKFNSGNGEQLRVTDGGAASTGFLNITGSTSGSNGVYLTSSANAMYLSASNGNNFRFFSNGSGIAEQFRISHTASAVNYVQVTGAATGGNPSIQTAGSDTNRGLSISSKGTSAVGIYSSAGTYLQFQVVGLNSAVNYFQAVGSTTGFGPVLAAAGSDTNIPAVVQPKGTGALQAQQTDSTATGGNARGANAVDWQTSRTAASQVANGSAAVIGGGQNNTASVLNSTVGGGLENRVSGGYGTISGGYNNSVSGGGFNFLGGGNSNTNNGNTAVLVGGSTNSSSGFYNFVGGGFTNSATSASAVTTQSATMNGTTAVTLSGSNASIKVGQYITGTSIAGDTYVAAISGTSLTLSKVASGSSTSTLSFFTPHGVVVGGGNNQATGSYSFIGGGGDAGTAANRNVASGAWSVVVGGIKNTASGLGSFVGGGGGDGAGFYANTASGTSAVVVGGTNNISSGALCGVLAGVSNNANGYAAFIGAGYANTSNGLYSAISAGAFGTARGIASAHIFPSNSPISSASGVSQGMLLVLGRETTNATPAVLTCDTSAGGTTNQVILPNNSAYYFKGSVIANVTGGGNTKAWAIEGAIKRGANAASTALVGTPTVTSAYADVGAATWAITATADTTNGGLAITFTGQAATTIRCVAKLETTEVTF